jgi:hypothetical protein
MGTTSTALPVPAPRFGGRRTWLALALAGGLLLGGAITAIELTNDGAAPAVGPVDTRAYENTPVTGTGPGLIQVADQSAASNLYSGTPVTGTGPGLTEVADQSAATRAYQGTPITGTGPDLAEVAGSQVAGPFDRGAVSPGHRAMPGAGRSAGSPGIVRAPAPADCFFVAGHSIC